MHTPSPPPAPLPSDPFARIEARLDALEARLERATHLMEQALPTLSIAIDTLDEQVARSIARTGVLPQDRLAATAHLVERLTDPTTADALQRLLDRVTHLSDAAALLDQIPGLIAMTADIADEQLSHLPRTPQQLVASAHKWLSLAADLDDAFTPDALALLRHAAQALATTARDGAAPVGMFGALRKLGHPSVQRATGLLLETLRRLGEHLDGPNTPNTKRLPSP